MLEVNIRSIFAHTEVLRGNASTICSLHNQLDQWREEVEGQPEPDLSQPDAGCPSIPLTTPTTLRSSESIQITRKPPSAEASCRNQVPPAVSPAFKTSSSQPPPQPATLQALSAFKRPALQWCIEITSSNFHLPPLPAQPRRKRRYWCQGIPPRLKIKIIMMDNPTNPLFFTTAGAATDISVSTSQQPHTTQGHHQQQQYGAPPPQAQQTNDHLSQTLQQGGLEFAPYTTNNNNHGVPPQQLPQLQPINSTAAAAGHTTAYHQTATTTSSVAGGGSMGYQQQQQQQQAAIPMMPQRSRACVRCGYPGCDVMITSCRCCLHARCAPVRTSIYMH